MSMSTSTNKTGIKAAILTMSFLQMATNAIASILANIAGAFPDVPALTIQYLMTFPNLLVVVVSVLAAKLAMVCSKKVIASAGLLFGSLAGILSFFFHGRIVLLFVWAGLLGIGIGMVVPMATSLVSDYFSENEKDVLLGWQSGAANVGSMLMTYIGSWIAIRGWHYNYLVYLLTIPGLILTLLFVPFENVKTNPQHVRNEAVVPGKKKISIFIIMYIAIAPIFMFLFYVGPTNLAMLVEERHLGTAVTAGTAATILLIGGAMTGLIFGKIAARIGKNTVTLGFFVLMVGFLLIYFSSVTGILYVGCFLVGTSSTLVLPQCMGQMVTEDKEQTTFLMSVMFSIANLGTFLTPVLTRLSELIMGNNQVRSRFLFTAVLAGILMFLFGFIINKKPK